MDAALQGWQLYTSSQGFPYYFNHTTGVSEWATFAAPEAATTTTTTSSSTSDTTSTGVSVVTVSAPDMEVAKGIARHLIGAKLAACVQIQDKVTSIYEWEGVVEESSEVILTIKVRFRLALSCVFCQWGCITVLF
jgi:hypothetical protein